MLFYKTIYENIWRKLYETYCKNMWKIFCKKICKKLSNKCIFILNFSLIEFHSTFLWHHRPLTFSDRLLLWPQSSEVMSWPNIYSHLPSLTIYDHKKQNKQTFKTIQPFKIYCRLIIIINIIYRTYAVDFRPF